MKNITKTALAASLFVLAGTASAVPITGSIGFTGAYTHNGSNLSDATMIDITGDTATVAGDVTGTFAAQGVSAGDVATYQDFTFDPTGAVASIWTVGIPGGSISFNLNSMSVDFQSANLLALSGTGEFVSDVAGLDAAFGKWTFTANETGANLTFSSSSAPEPGVALLLGAGLLGFGASRKLRKS